MRIRQRLGQIHPTNKAFMDVFDRNHKKRLSFSDFLWKMIDVFDGQAKMHKNFLEKMVSLCTL